LFSSNNFTELGGGMRSTECHSGCLCTNDDSVSIQQNNIARELYSLRVCRLVTLRASWGAVYCNRSCMCVGVGVGGSVTTITRNCVHRSSPNWFVL